MIKPILALVTLSTLASGLAAEAEPTGGTALVNEALAAPLEVTLTPYLWALSLDGHATVKGVKSDVDVSLDELLQHLNGAVMLEAEIRKGRFGILSDTIFANLYDDENSQRLEVETDANQLIQTLAATYRVGTWRFSVVGDRSVTLTVDPYLGARLTYLDSEISAKLDLQDLGIKRRDRVDGDKFWVDAITGLRTIWTVGEHWEAVLAGDLGGYQPGEDFTWQTIGVLGYRFSLFGDTDARILAGYRALYQNYEDGNGENRFEWDITMHGPVLGFSVSF